MRYPIACAALAMLLQCVAVSTASATATIILVNGDGPNEGLNDPTAVPAVTGNPGTTLGEQRLNVFQAAANVWEQVLDSSVPIRINAAMDPLTCSPTGGVLGSAGPNGAFRDFTGAPRANTWYPGALANSLAGSDLDTTSDDIGATFNSDVDDDPNCLTGITWWYGVGAAAPAFTISLYDTVLHEIAHGIGFLTFVNSATGQTFFGFDDIYMTFLEDHSLGLGWPGMTDAQRAASVIDTGDLHWTGAANNCAIDILTAGTAGGHTRMYAPNPVELGSSVSHWDTALMPDELMEPLATPTSDRRITDRLLADIGWTVLSGPCPPVAIVVPVEPPKVKGEHYLCYRIDDFGGFRPVEVKLKDQFDGYVTAVVRPVSLCNPVDKNGEGIMDPKLHLVCYEIKPVRSPRRTVVAYNQFGKEQKLTSPGPETLCVPSYKKILQ